jgi:hypothetical protein
MARTPIIKRVRAYLDPQPPAVDPGTQPVDPDLAAIDELERRIIKAHDDKAAFGVSAAELARQRPDVVRLARAVADQLRAEHAARSGNGHSV